MANDIVQTIADARVDARSLSEFVFKPADFIVTRRLAPSVRTLQFYVNSLSLAVTEAQGKVAYIESTVQAAINNTAVDGGVLADTFVTMTKNGRGSVARTLRDVNSDTLYAKDFGAVGNGLSNPLSTRFATLAEAQAEYPHATSLDDELDWCGLQALLTYASSSENRSTTINWGGNWVLNKGVYYGVFMDSKGESRTICGDFYFSLTDSFVGDYVILLHGRMIKHTGTISGYVDRKAKYGIIVDANELDSSMTIEGLANYNSYGIEIDRVYIHKAIITGIKFQAKAMFNTLNFFRGDGHGCSSTGIGFKSEATVTSKTLVAINTLKAQSSLVVSRLPEVGVEDCAIYVVYGGYVSIVKSIDASTNTIVVEPNLPDSSDGNVLKYVWGSAVSVEGSDSAGLTIKQLTAFGTGTGIEHRGMYPVTVLNIATEYCGIAIVDRGLVGGLSILELYTEGGFFDFITDNQSKGTYGGTAILHGTGKDFSKYADLAWRRGLNGEANDSAGGLRGVSINNKGVIHTADKYKRPANYTSGVIDIDFNLPHSNTIYKGDSGYHFKFVDVVKNINDLFCYDSQEITIIGTGQNNAPQGSITIFPLDGYRLNGGTSNVVLSGFSSACHIIAFLDVVNKNIRISCSSVSGNALNVSTEYPFTQLNADPSKTGSFAITNYTQVGDMPTPTATTVQALVRGYIISGSVWQGDYKVIQEVTFPDIHEVWTRTYNNIGGVFSTWVLKDYVIRKGTTAERPVNPQLGMQFYDTTLLGVGKPINWNGSVWVDALGVAV